jgi:hypothetical protein
MTVEERIGFLIQSAESHDRQIGELVSRVNTLTENVQKLVDVSSQDATAIRTLARIADVHEQRVRGLEEGLAMKDHAQPSISTR